MVSNKHFNRKLKDAAPEITAWEPENRASTRTHPTGNQLRKRQEWL
jgi:hypothetical protein